MVRTEIYKTKVLLKSYIDIIEDLYDVDLTKSKVQKEHKGLLLIFIKFIKHRYSRIRNRSIALFLNIPTENILLYLKKHDELFLMDKLFREKSSFLRDRFWAINSENRPETYKTKLYALIDNSPESVRKEFYELIFNHHDILKSNLYKTK